MAADQETGGAASGEGRGRLSRPVDKAGMTGWALYDWAGNGYVTVIETFVFAAYFTRQVAVDETTGTAQWGFTLALAGFLVAVGGPVLGAAVDHTGRRKPWIAAFTLICVIGTAMLWFVEPSPDSLWLALPVVGVTALSFELATIFYNAMLPRLVRPERIGRWSGWGWSCGYAGGLGCLVAALLLVLADRPLGLDPAAAEPVRAAFVLAALWYLLFALPFFLYTPDTPGTGMRFTAALRAGLGRLRQILREMRRYRYIVRFLIAHMVYINGLGTLFVFGGIYAAGAFDMTEQEVLVFGIALNVTAGLGAASFAWVDDHIGSKRTIQIALVGLIVSGSAILLVESLVLFWAFGLALGLFVGPVQAAGRSFLARATPPDLQNQMFGLLALSGKATAFLGPLSVALVTLLTGSQRAGMSMILVFFVAGFLIMLAVPRARHSRPEGM